MAKRFQFDDDDDILDEYHQPTHVEKHKDIQVNEPVVEQSMTESSFEYQDTYEEENQGMAKKKKKMKWKWWHYALITLFALFIAFAVYIFALSNNDGPVYGNRGDGIVVIEKDLQNAAVDTMKNKYPEIQSLAMETRCKQLRINIQFKDGMDTKKAQKIAEETVRTLDNLVGKEKDKGMTYSQLFGKINNVPQYEVNLILSSKGSKDFPIYGTKHIQNDKFSYTLASIKDKNSYNKAQESLKK